MEQGKTKGFAVAGHEALFETPSARETSDDGERCDACGSPIDASLDDDDDANPYAVGGHGRFLWTRGAERRNEEPPLCPSCAAAIGIVALQQWNAEEDEG